MSAPALAYVAVVVDDAQAVADTFENALQLPRETATAPGGGPVPVIAVGATTIALFEPDHPFLGAGARNGVHHIAIAAADPAALAAGCSLTTTSAGEGLAGASAVTLDPATTCGIETRLCQPLAIEPGSSRYVQRIDHIGVASVDNQAAGRVFTDVLGCPVESTQTDFEIAQPIESFTSDKYGVIHHSRTPDPIGGLRVSFLTVGECELELLQPIDPRNALQASQGPQHNAPGTTRGDKGAIARYIERRGPGLHHLALKAPDIDSTLDHLSRSGLRIIDHVGRPGSRAARIGFVHPAALGGLLVHFVEREEL